MERAGAVSARDRAALAGHPRLLRALELRVEHRLSLRDVGRHLGITAQGARHVLDEAATVLTGESDLDRLPRRVRRALEHRGYRTPDDVARLTDGELLRIPRIGPKGLAAIRSIIPTRSPH